MMFSSGEVFRVLSPSDTPYKHVYPDADKVLYSRGEIVPEQWIYVSSENSVENLLGFAQWACVKMECLN